MSVPHITFFVVSDKKQLYICDYNYTLSIVSVQKLEPLNCIIY